MLDERKDAVWLHVERRFTLVELADASGLPQDVLRELVDFGVLSPRDPADSDWDFSADCVGCLRAAARLGSDFELETHALALVLSYLQRVERLEAEVRALRALQPRQP